MNGKTSLFTSQKGEKSRGGQIEGHGWVRAMVGLLFAVCVGTAYSGELTLSWNDNSDNEDGFHIERAIQGQPYSSLGSVGTDVTTFADTTVLEGESYTYRVRAFNEFGYSDYSNVASGSVPLPNAAPSISVLSDVSLLEGGESGSIAFSISDAETAATALGVSAISSNQALLPDGAIELGGSGSSRWMILRPVSGASGSATVTISVSDGTDATEASFQLFVQSITAPTITPIQDLSVLRGDAVPLIPFVIADRETLATSLSVSVTSSNETLFPAGSITVSGSSGDRALQVKPAAEQFGSATITVSVSDGTGEAIEAFVLSVVSAPIVLSQPTDKRVYVGDDVSFTVSASAYPAPKYQWRYNGIDIEGANQATLDLSSVGADRAGLYSVVVSNGVGSVSSVGASLSVESRIHLTQAPVDQTITRKSGVLLTIGAEGTGLTYQWYLGASGDRSNPISGATASSYQTETLSASATYWVELSSGVETWASDTIHVSFDPVNSYYFGSFASAEGSFGLMVRSDNSAVFLGYAAALGGTLEMADMTVSPEGSFTYLEKGAIVLSGQIDGTTVSGAASGGVLAFSGTQANTEGATASFAGFYYASMTNTSDGQALVIAGPDQQGFATTARGEYSIGGAVPVSVDGTIATELGVNDLLAIHLDPTTARMKGSVESNGTLYSVNGYREDVETNKVLANTSIRAQTTEGASTMIAGFVVSGSSPKKVLIRGVGPSLEMHGLTDYIKDTRVTLYRLGESEPIDQNDNWAQASNAAEVAASSQLVGAFPLASGSKDAALLVELPAGVYTAHVTSVDGSLGTALVEVYDVSEAENPGSGTTLANISLRGDAGPGDNVIIAGFVVSGDAPKRLLIRAMGSELQRYGVTGTLADPKLDIYQRVNGQMKPILSNDDWVEDAQVAKDTAARVGAFPFDDNSKSAAQVVWLEPGVYTALASSGDGTPGNTLVEVYEVK